MAKRKKEIKKVLWLDDQHDDFDGYKSALFRAGYTVHNVKSVTETVEELKKEDYIAAVFDIKVLPGDGLEWIDLDKKKREEKPGFGAYLGLELMRSLFKPGEARVKIDPPVNVDPGKVIVFSVVFDKTEEITSFGIPGDQIVYKANSKLDTLPQLIKKIQDRNES